MSRAAYFAGVIEKLPTLTDSQLEYLYHLIDGLFGKKEVEV